ncbi:sensor histidine kinase [Streptomyces xantholiticus]|uniref:sensor histidine kinase n=1 Tax=Streptomyces xantholiticus TaxID=68285 RepID=UPI00167B3F08|nr:ATP-binding protein [Streptomyces xantholiticus]
MESALRRSFAGMALLFVVAWWIVVASLVVSGSVGLHPLTSAAAVLFAGCTAAWAYRGAFVRIGRYDALTAVAVALAVHAAYALEQPDEIVTGLRCMVTVTAVLLAVAYLPGVWGRPLAVVCLAAQVAAGWHEGMWTALEGIWPPFAGGVAAAVLAPVMRGAGERADAAVREDLDASEAAAREQAARRSQRDFQRLLHDDVGAALRAAGTRGVPVDEQRAEARRAVAGLTAGAAPEEDGAETDLVSLLSGLVATSVGGLPRPRVSTDFPSGGLPLPHEVAAACTGAAVEALRNVRYAGASHVHVRLSGDRRALELAVCDNGKGFSVSQVRKTAVGLQDSVRQRMTDVGGEADVHSEPGRGTTVRLRWSSPVAAPGGGVPAGRRGRLETLRAAVGDVRAPLAAVCLPYLAVMVVVAVVRTVHMPQMVAHLVWYAALTAATCILLGRAHRRISAKVAAVLLVVATAGAVSSLLVIPPEGITDYRSWPIGAVTPLLTLLVVVRPLRQTALALACEEAGIVILVAADPPAAATPTGAVAMALPAMLAPAMGVVMGLVIRRTLVTLGGAVLDAHRHRMVVVATESAARARAVQHRRRLAEIDEQVLPFLRSVATGETHDPGALRGRADRLAQSIRDELHLPGVFDRPLRELVGGARESGCVVTVHAHADLDVPPVDAAARTALVRSVLSAALRGQETPAEMVLSIQDGARQPGLSLVVMPGDTRRADALRAALEPGTYTLEDTADLTWAEVSFRRS